MRLTGTDLEQWAVRVEARAQLPELVGRLIRATVDSRALVRLVMPAGAGTGKPGVDGLVETRERNPWVPEGVSIWEMGCDRDYAKKAQTDYRQRTEACPPGVNPEQATYLFVTPWLWAKKKPDLETWQQSRRERGPWKDVRLHDADALVSWLHAAPEVQAWFAELLGRPGPVRTLEWSWREWSRATIPSSSEGLVLAGRDEQKDVFLTWLQGPPDTLGIRASEPGEVAAFCWAALSRLQDPSRMSQLERALIVFGDDELRRLVLDQRPLLLIARECSYEVARHAASVGHHVILANSTNSLRDTLVLGSLEPQRAQLELEHMRSPKDPYELVRRLRGSQPGDPGVSLAAIRRELGGRDDDLPRELAPLCLVGGWKDQEDDRQIVSEILGEDPAWLRRLLQRHGGEPTSPLVRSGVDFEARWRWASRRDAWRQLEPRLSSEVLERFESVFIEVFGDASGRGSDELRSGLLEGLALLAVDVSSSRGEHDRRLPERVVGRLLYPPRVEAWASLAWTLPVLAEAAPDTFLECAERFVSEHLDALVSDARVLSGAIAALELLAWVADYLFRVTELLAKIGSEDPTGPAGKQSREALCNVYLPWRPNTAASADARAHCLDWLASEHTEIAFELMLELLSKRSRFVSPGPRYRDWSNREPEITQADANEAYVEIWSRLLELARVDARRWVDVFQRLLSLAPDRSRRAEAVAKLAQLDVSQLDAVQREELRGRLRGMISKHRAFDDANWSMPEPLLEQLEALYDRLAPKDLRDELEWVFATAPQLLHPSRRDRADPKAVRPAQLEAAKRLTERFTPSELVAFANRVSSPWALGNALASLGNNKHALELLQASIGQPSDASHELRRGLGHVLFRRNNGFEAWRDDAVRALPAALQAELLLGCPSQPETWDFAESLGPEVAEAYWLGAAAVYPHDRGDLERVVRSLVAVGRVEDATGLMASARGTGFGSLDPELVVKLLDATLAPDLDDESSDPEDSFLITALLEQLRTEGDRWHDELLRFEWIALPILDIYHGDQPTTHYAELARRPEFFVDMVRLADSWSERANHGRPDSERAWTLLQEWHGLPGRQDDGSIDIEELRQWIHQARARLREAELSEAGDRRLGQVLANAPEGTDGRWPHESVREIIEELGDAPHIRDALVTARGNWWSWSNGGFVNTERDLAQAEKLREDAAALRIRHPRTARVLEELAQRKTHDAGFWTRHHDLLFDGTSRVTTEVRIDRALDELETNGRLVFDLDQLRAEIIGAPTDLPFALGRHRRVAHIEDDLYVIVEPKYRRVGAPPPWWYLDELMRRRDTEYCVGLLSAAALHGAADQQPQIVQVLVSRPREALEVGAHTIEFIHRERKQTFDSARVNTETGTMAIATAEATVFDLSEHTNLSGGHDAVVAVLEELAEEIDPDRLLAAAAAYPTEVVEHAAELLRRSGHEQLARSLRSPSTGRALA